MQSSPNSETHSGSIYHAGMSSEVEDILRAMLTVPGFKQKDLADVAGVTQGTVSRWLRGQEPGASQWAKIIRHAAKDPRTRHLAHRYASSVLGHEGLRGFWDAALTIQPANSDNSSPRRTKQERK